MASIPASISAVEGLPSSGARTTVTPLASRRSATPARGPPPPAPARCGSAAGVDDGREVGDPDPVRHADGQRGLDGGSGVVDVHVDVPQRVPAHDHQRVAEPGQAGLEPRDGLVGGVEQVHHLVRRPAVAVQHVLGIGQGVRLRCEAGELRELAVDAGDDLEEGVGEHHVAAAAGIDHARAAQRLELGGGRAPGPCARPRRLPS